MVCAWHELRAERVHFLHRADLACVAEVVGEHSARKAWARCRLNRNELVVLFTAQFFSHERAYKSAQIRAATGASYYYVRLDSILVHRGLCFHSDYRLVKQYLAQDRAKNVSVAVMLCGVFHRFRNRAAQRAGASRIFGVNLSSYFSFHAWRRNRLRSVSSDYLAALWLLFIGTPNLINAAVQTKICARHGHSGSPLAGSCFRSNAFKPLLLCVECLGDCRVQLVAS